LPSESGEGHLPASYNFTVTVLSMLPDALT
jgi:hypothetical protein